MRDAGTRLTPENKRQCYVCGKIFWCAREYVYKKVINRKREYFCSYSCMRKFEEEKRKQKYA